jgi:uncharacterized protein (DUF1800 family)
MLVVRGAAVLGLASALGGCLTGGGGGSSSAAPATSAAPAAVPAPAPTATSPLALPATQTPPPQPLEPLSAEVPTTDADAVRFLEQATFGPTEATIPEVQRKGPARALDEQFNQPMTGYPSYAAVDPDPRKGCPDGSPDTCYRDNYTAFPLQVKFFQNALGGPDQLRQRVAFALSQIIVVSGVELETMHGIGYFQQILMRNAFGSFRTLLQEITLSPAMGEYLDMVNNPKPDPARGIEPNENYARELLQLFAIGEVMLNPDGTYRYDAGGNLLPAYTQEDVEDLARALTGWIYPTRPGTAPKFPSHPWYVGQMLPYASQHDTGAKSILGRTLPAGQTAQKDLADALDVIFQHPNMGPFIGRQLIQHLVTSNPSGAYVARVAAAFDNNGRGVRGDMKAVLRAVLLDQEARGAVKTAADYGKLREPVLFMTGVLRALGGTSDGVHLLDQSTRMGQNVFNAPSVFNFYPPHYTAPGTSLEGPPFKLMLTGTILNRANFVDRMVFNGNVGRDTTVPGSTGTRVDLARMQALAANPGQLLDRLDLVFMHRTLSAQARQSILQAVQAYPASDPLGRARQAIYLVATSPQYQVEQ